MRHLGGIALAGLLWLGADSCAFAGRDALAGAAAAQTKLESTSMPFRVGAIFDTIKSDYVRSIEDRQLVDGCEKGMLRRVPTAMLSPQSVEISGRQIAIQEINAAYSSIRRQAGTPLSDDDLSDACIIGMFDTLDRQSEFIDQEAFRELQVGEPLSVGIGLSLAREAGRLVVALVTESGPGDRAGIRRNDAVLQIDDTEISGAVTRARAAKLLRGAEGSEVRLIVVRPDSPVPVKFVVKRERIVTGQDVRADLLPHGIAYVRIAQFEEKTGERLATALRSLYSKGPDGLNGLILDLRRNPGGLLNSCVAVSAAFLPRRSLIVSTNGRTADASMKLLASPEYYIRGNNDDYYRSLPSTIKTVPMAVLVSHTSAAGSEIVAAALQDHKRAQVVGEKTSGIDMVQTILPVGDGTALKLTTARFYRPSGGPIGPMGVTPDVVIETGFAEAPVPADMTEDPTVARAIEVLGGSASSSRQ